MNDGRPGLEVFSVSQGKWFQTTSRVYYAGSAGSRAYFVTDPHYMYEEAEIVRRCQQVVSQLESAKIARRRRNKRKRFDKESDSEDNFGD